MIRFQPNKLIVRKVTEPFGRKHPAEAGAAARKQGRVGMQVPSDSRLAPRKFSWDD